MIYRKGPSAPFKPPRIINAQNASSIIVNDIKPAGIDVKQNLEESLVLNKRSIILAKRANYDQKTQDIKKAKQNEPVVTLEPNNSQYYAVQWRKKSTKKNKTWEGDGIIKVSETSIVFKNANKKDLGRISRPKDDFLNSIISIGRYELEVDCQIDEREIDKSNIRSSPSPLVNEPQTIKEPEVTIVHQFKNPLSGFKKAVETRLPLYKIKENSLVMKRPPNLPDSKVVDVVVDPHLSSRLRDHQKSGVEFLYECVMGFRNFDGNGALLADEMGLGKSLMTITLIWTLFKQSPYIEDKGAIAKKFLICCPVTLIENWKKEFKKWLGINKISVLTLNSKQLSAGDKRDIINFGKLKVHQVLVMSYEKLVNCSDELSTVDFDLLVCDEGHKLKNSSNKALKVLKSLNLSRKVLLTGTPIQNDLTEFYTIIDFINPGVFGTLQQFHRTYIRPILISREINCNNPEVKRMGDEMSNNLVQLTKDFTLRRTSSILSSYLTSKTDIILFVPPTGFQLRLFKLILNSNKFTGLLKESEGATSNQCLSLITLFKKICNSPSLLADDKLFSTLIEGEISLTAGEISKKTASGKIKLLIPLLLEINENKEKIVLVSNYTQTLDLLEDVLRKMNLTFLRLDGSTPNKLRSSLVNQFNSDNSTTVFLLSSKSGGMGINLVGASRLILFDNDWNPSVDLQSMARIHRDGQTKPVFIYRIMTAGCIDEKIFQRQLMKNNLSKNFLDNDFESNSNVFDHNDLKNLFEVAEYTNSNTHDLLDCSCEGTGEIPELEVSQQKSVSPGEGCEGSNPSGWVTALDVKNTQSTVKEKKSLVLKNSLLEYKHYDVSKNKISGTSDIIIDKIISKSPNLISFLMCKLTESSSLEANT
ncbi:uncharacterized protein PRCAT00004723001 [Priceomyces carsonii]|uniref:uncharacterized protein n=1 Tax=Priceomyces carsonii TaxID=28549 RepID=UPI002EDA14AA|nr:unnamed protein product [Priceomyces carsonii]